MPDGKIKEIRSYSDLGKRLWGTPGVILVNIMMFIVQFSCCVGYLYFVAGQLDYMICAEANYCDKKTMYIYLLLIPAIPISLIKDYARLGKVSVVGIACALIGGLMLIAYCSNELYTHTYTTPVKVFDVVQTLGYIGIAMFAFEGNGVVLNLRASAKNPKVFPKLLSLGLLCIVIWYMILAILCYFVYRVDI